MVDTKRPKRFSRRAVLGFATVLMPALVTGLWRPPSLMAADRIAANPFADVVPGTWRDEWPNTDFSQTTVKYGEIQSGGPPKDGIPAIDRPNFTPLAEAVDLPAREPVVVVSVNGQSKIYPLRILTWHEIVNDVIGGVAVVVTYCPLCNTAIVFDARLDGQIYTFGTTGKLRNSDLVMYDRQTESWWQQFSGDAIIGRMVGRTLDMVPSRIESFDRARTRTPGALVLAAPTDTNRPYGSNPYVGYDTALQPFLFAGDLPGDIAPMMRVVAVGNRAWTLPLLRERGRIEVDDLVLSWTAGQNSALDTRTISRGRDVGNVTVQRRGAAGLVDVVHHVTFAFAFYAFQPDGTLFQN